MIATAHSHALSHNPISMIGNSNLIMPTATNSQNGFFNQNFQFGQPANYHKHTQPAASAQPIHRHARSQSFQTMPVQSTFSQISPSSNGASPRGFATPASPKSRHTGAQYVPAVLRPNEYPSKLPTKQQIEQINNSPKSSSDGSFKERRNSILNLASYAIPRLGRRATCDSKCSEDEWTLADFPEVTAEPTRKHWKPDTASSTCDDPSCMKTFSYFTRRHHCRRCGNIFCDPHSSFEVPLDQNAEFNPRAPMARSCRYCFHEFNNWKMRNSTSPSNSSASTESETAVQSPVLPSPMPQNGFLQPTMGSQEVAASVPRDWNWSTF